MEIIYSAESPIRHPGRMVNGMLRDLVAARGLAWRLFIRDLSAQYRQSVLGYLWAFGPPVLAALPWLFLNQQNIVSVGDVAIPASAFVLCGTTLWQTFMDALNSPLKQTNAARSMLAKINFPREALLLAGLGECVWNLAMRLVLLIPLLGILGVPYTAALVWVPVGIAGLILMGFSLGLILTPVGMLYTDVGRAISVIAGFAMLLTPVLYAPPKAGTAAWLASWNPVSPVLNATRNWLTGQPVEALGAFVAILALSAVVLAVAWLLYRLAMPVLVERMGG